MHMLRRFVALPALLVVSCSGASGPTTTTRDWVWGWNVPVPPRAPERDASVSTILYAGGTVREATFDLTAHGLSGLAEVRLMTVGRQDLRVWRAADVPADGHLTGVPPVQGGAARLVINAPAGIAWPAVTVNAVRVTEAPTGPEEGALTVSAGETIDTHFENERRAVFLKVAPLGHDALDIVAFGAGDVRIADPAASDFVVDPQIAWGVAALARGGAPIIPSGMVRVSAAVVSASQALRVAWVPPDAAAAEMVPDPGHARLVISPVKDLKLAFPAGDRHAFLGHWFGVDRDGKTQSSRGCSATDLACKAAEQLDKLECTNWNGENGIVKNRITGLRAPVLEPRCYDGHRGTDFVLRTAVIGQAIGVDVLAAQRGVVVFADDGHPDDCFFSPFAGGIRCADVQYKHPFWEELRTQPETPPNLVAVRQDDGLVAWYFHLRQGSVSVAVGQSVACGQKIGQAGSAGHSSGPHLHYELRGLRGSSPIVPSFKYGALLDTSDTVDPFPDHWVSRSDAAPPDNTCP